MKFPCYSKHLFYKLKCLDGLLPFLILGREVCFFLCGKAKQGFFPTLYFRYKIIAAFLIISSICWLSAGKKTFKVSLHLYA